MPEFSEELKQKCFEADNFCCQKCGEDEQLQPAHVQHRGAGGDPSQNRLGNLITFCGKCHNEYDKGQFTIDTWDRNDKENGLVIYRNFAMREKGKDVQQRIPNEELYFYKIPTKALATKAQKKDQEFKETIKHAIKVDRQLIRLAFEMRYQFEDGRPLYRGVPRNDNKPGETYESFREYLRGEILPLWDRWNSPRTPENYVSSYKAVHEFVESEDEFEKIPPGSYSDLAGALRNEDLGEDDKQYLLDRAKELPSGEFQQEKRDIVKDNGKNGKASYKNCDKLIKIDNTAITTATNDNEYHVGKKGFTICPETGVVIESLFTSKKRKLPCEECDYGV